MDLHAHLDLRPINHTDGPALSRVHSHPEVVRWFAPEGQDGQLTAEEFDEMARRKSAHWDAHGFGQYLVWDGEEPVARGGAQISVIEGRPELEIGMVVVPSLQGVGIAKWLAQEGGKSALAAGFTEAVAMTRADNRAALIFPELFGFPLEREFVHNGHPQLLFRGRDLARLVEAAIEAVGDLTQRSGHPPLAGVLGEGAQRAGEQPGE